MDKVSNEDATEPTETASLEPFAVPLTSPGNVVPCNVSLFTVCVHQFCLANLAPLIKRAKSKTQGLQRPKNKKRR